MTTPEPGGSGVDWTDHPDLAAATDRLGYAESDEELLAATRTYARLVCRIAEREGPGLAVDLSRVVEWSVSSRAKRRAAAVRYQPVPGAEVGTALDWDAVHREHADRLADSRFEDFRECAVVCSRRAFEAFSPEEWARTVRHELLHVEQVQRFGRTDHGQAFGDRGAAFDTATRCPSFHTGRYLLRCRDCGEPVLDRCRECKTTRLAREPPAVQRGRLRPSPCCGAYYDLEDTGSG